MGLSVLIICKDESTVIPGAIEYAQGVADEIIVVDGLSGDGTIEVVADLAVRSLVPLVLHVRRMKGGFAEQRNFGVSRCSHDWVLQLDADERYTPSLARKLPELLTNDKVAAYSFPTLHMVDDVHHCNSDADPHVRLFRNMDVIRFDGEIHEHLTLYGNTLFAHPSHFDGFTAHHVRYVSDVWLMHFANMKTIAEKQKKIANWRNWFAKSSAAGIPVSEDKIISEYDGPRLPLPEGALE